MKTPDLKNSIKLASTAAHQWFFANACEKTQTDWDISNALDDSGIGAVYAFFNERGECLYVGQTLQLLKARARLQTSRHLSQSWWPKWRRLRFVNISDRTDQIVLETLLILSLSPKHNTKPAARNIQQMFPEH